MEQDPATIRPATPADLDAVGEIYAHYVMHTTITFELRVPDRHEWSARYRAITETGLPFLVAELDGRIAGYAYCARWKSRPAYRHTAEDSIYLAPWALGRGLGRALLAELLRVSPVAGVRELIAVVADTGEPASLRLHERLGFAEVGRLRRVGYKHDRWLDTVLLQCSLSADGGDPLSHPAPQPADGTDGMPTPSASESP
ncbi:GNAT family N-acetyltransferase [Plantactinospora soyae]|uniref:Phosphinothricin acetyltransferase n=1 Tax=Plantactinospora soyae TaxID=1544732 RepID=A0A927R9Q8_9ACTN|nr:GNAT family N-acetyltransferase [Plantactinospora soyae]MBE1491669.1 phosphinothricin acetyltransferase [Plantactinospora soyae]